MAAVCQMSQAIRDVAIAALAAGEQPVLIGGDHSLALGTLAAGCNTFGRMAVIWVDAHGDFNTPTSSPSGNPHGMPLAAACGLGDARMTSLFTHFVRGTDVVLIGAREIDPDEQALLDAHGVWQIGVKEVREKGVDGIVAAIVARLGELPVHLSFDFDALGADRFMATGTPSSKGFEPEEGEALLTALAASPLAIGSSDWVEFDPRHPRADECAALARRMFQAFYRQ